MAVGKPVMAGKRPSPAVCFADGQNLALGKELLCRVLFLCPQQNIFFLLFLIPNFSLGLLLYLKVHIKIWSFFDFISYI